MYLFQSLDLINIFPHYDNELPVLDTKEVRNGLVYNNRRWFCPWKSIPVSN